MENKWKNPDALNNNEFEQIVKEFKKHQLPAITFSLFLVCLGIFLDFYFQDHKFHNVIYILSLIPIFFGISYITTYVPLFILTKKKRFTWKKGVVSKNSKTTSPIQAKSFSYIIVDDIDCDYIQNIKNFKCGDLVYIISFKNNSTFCIKI
jgi:hypothetical protein